MAEIHRVAGAVGGYTNRSRNDPTQYTAAARQTFACSFIDRVDPDRVLTEKEREARVKALKKAHYRALALRAIQARTKTSRKKNRGPAAAAEPRREVPRGAEPTSQSSAG